jgi:sugar phosphate permease
LLQTSFPEGRERTRAVAYYGAVAGVGASIGLVLGGVVTDWISWRVGFFINVPIGIAMILATPRYLAETERRPGKLDLIGGLAGGLAVTLSGMAWLSRLSADSAHLTAIALPMVLIGAGQGATPSPLTAAGMAGVAPEDAGAASGLVNVAHQLGGSLGLGILVTVFAAVNPGNLDAQHVLAHRVAVALTAGTVMLAPALVLVLTLIVRGHKTAGTAEDAPVSHALTGEGWPPPGPCWGVLAVPGTTGSPSPPLTPV